ncbi:MAG: heme-binding domain-containing protein [Bacteroidales bacterium]|nr:heme-binding domain-containing protein [Bacteroidales bacterium]
MKSAKVLVIVLVLGFIVIQFIPPGIPGSKPEDDNNIVKSGLLSDHVTGLLRKSCFDCHTDQTELPWYSGLAPVSWLLADHINEGKSHLNFSEWGSYSTREKIGKLEDIKDEIESGGMPLKSYLLMHPEAKLNPEEVKLLVNWAAEASSKILE